MKRLKRDDLLVSLLEECDRKSVVDIWSQAFLDSEDFINSFLDFSGAKTYIYRENGAVVGMFSVFEVEVHGEKGGYIYALAVEENHRGKSIASKMLESAHRMFQDGGYAFSIVVPEPYSQLEAFYKKRGYQNDVELYVEEVVARDFDISYEIRSADALEYFSARNIDANVLKHSERFFIFVYNDIKSGEAELLKISVGEESAFCICYYKDKYVIIKEAFGTIDKSLLTQIVAKRYGVEKAVCISQFGLCRYPYALLKKFTPNFDCSIYANLLLDSFELRF